MFSLLLFASKHEELGGEIDFFFCLSSCPVLFISYRNVNTALIRKTADTIRECAPPLLSIIAVFALNYRNDWYLTISCSCGFCIKSATVE